MSSIRKGDKLVCLDVTRNSDLERGFAIYPGEHYIANDDSYMHEGQELVELVENGDGEPITHYPVRFFNVIESKYPPGSVAFSKFVRRQTPESEFSHFEITEDQVLDRVTGNWKNYKEGYRDGVILVPVHPDGFFSSLIQLKEGDLLIGQYKARREGEKPRKSTWAAEGQKMPAKQVDIILYRADVLAEDNDRSTDADWEIISINASPVEGEMPIPTGALIANHLHLSGSGGTATNMTDSEFVALLRKSVEFWGDKINLAPANLRGPVGFIRKPS